jgi:hypothetical protein
MIQVPEMQAAALAASVEPLGGRMWLTATELSRWWGVDRRRGGEVLAELLANSGVPIATMGGSRPRYWLGDVLEAMRASEACLPAGR